MRQKDKKKVFRKIFNGEGRYFRFYDKDIYDGWDVTLKIYADKETVRKLFKEFQDSEDYLGELEEWKEFLRDKGIEVEELEIEESLEF